MEANEEETPTMTTATETTVLAALALAAQQYADPTPCYDAIRELFPNVSWDEWITRIETHRNDPEALVASLREEN